MEAALLTGGASRRMGRDKASLLVDGVPQANRIARALRERGVPVTVLGREPVVGCGFLPDEERFRGPLAALARFRPQEELVMVLSCDLPLFDVRLVDLLAVKIGDRQAAVPHVCGFRQPLCALYRASAFAALSGIEESCTMAWVDALPHTIVSEAEIQAAGISPLSTQGANTPEELQELLSRV